MKIAVVGLWHLGTVTAACLSDAGYDVVAYDPDATVIENLKKNKPPLFEPGLTELLTKNQVEKKLHFSFQPSDLSACEIVWITFDTPVDDQDVADTAFVMQQIQALFPYLSHQTFVLISSQLPAGSTRQLQQHCLDTFPDKQITFAYSPENLRLGKALLTFTQPDRIIVGLASVHDKNRIESVLKTFTDNILWMSIESAEMTKHALNAFLATSVVFINEIATLCEQVGANAEDVERGLKTEERIGPKAYLRAGNAIAGGTLARDVQYLIQLGTQKTLSTPLFSSLLTSNNAHKQWSCHKIRAILKNLHQKTIATLGLTYTTNTDTLRRSASVETCRWLKNQGATVVAYDPRLNNLPSELHSIIELKTNLLDAIQGADAIVIANPCPEFELLQVDQIIDLTNKAPIIDPSGFLTKTLGNDERLRYFCVGRHS